MPALESISLLVDAGRPCGVLGPSGSGKSALAAALVGTLPLASGTFTLQPPTTHPLRVSVLPQGPVLWPRSARALWQLLRSDAAQQRGMSNAQQRGMSNAQQRGMSNAALPPGLPDAALARLPLPAARRAVLQVLLSLEPDLLIVDEPAETEANAVREWRALISQAAQAGTRVLVLSRNEAVLAACCTDIAILFDGRFAAAGAFTELAPAAVALAQRRYGSC